jgi:heme/copper-type cytochrome/quinol oxidase subunit 2
MFEEFSVLNFFIIFFVFCAIIIPVVLVASIFLARAKNQSSSQTEKVIEKETIKEIVIVPCIYCGSLNPQTELFCKNCGAGRKT